MTGIKERFTATLRSLRKRRGLTQEEAAKLADISANYWGKLERGQSEAEALTIDTLWDLCMALEAEPREIEHLFQSASDYHLHFFEDFAQTILLLRGDALPLDVAIEADDDLDSEGKQQMLRTMRIERLRMLASRNLDVHTPAEPVRRRRAKDVG